MLIDSHAHIFDMYYDDIKGILSSAFDNNVKIVISCGCDHNTNIETIKKVSAYKCLYGALGIHPEYQDDYTDSDFEYIKENLNNDKIVAIGEIGLDYHYENADKNKQQILLEKQLEIAGLYHLPVIVHSRDAGYDTLNILKKYPVTGVIHAFSGSVELAREYIKLGYLLGVGGVATFKNAHIKDVIKEVGIENCILETDSPYLSPEPLRGSQNSPSNIPIIAKFLSDYLNLPYKQVMDITTQNVYKLFSKITKI